MDAPRLCLVGPMVGHNPGYVTTHGEKLASLLTDAGYPVLAVSSLANRYRRLGDIVTTLVRYRRQIDVLMLDVYGGRSFVVEDLASRLGGYFGHRIVMTLHGGAMPQFMARFPRWSRRVLSRAHVLTAPSEFLARAARGFDLNVQVIPNVIDLPRYPYRLRESVRPRLFWMRSFHPMYNPLMALRALALLRSDISDATLVMGGQDRGFRAEVLRAATAMKFDGAVSVEGFLDMSRKLHEGSQADIFINTSRVDNTPIAILEACAMGLPVVSTAVGGVPDLLANGDSGLLVSDDDAKAMAEAVRTLVNDPSLARRLSENGRRLAERSSWEQVRPRWERVLTTTTAHSSEKLDPTEAS